MLPSYLECQVDNYLCGESEEEFVDRFSLAIWKANQEFCSIEIIAIDLEEPPQGEYSRSEDDYARINNT